MNKLASFFNGFSLGAPQTYENMTVYPLHTPNGHTRRYRTLDEALQDQAISVTEVNEGGSVPDLKVKNTGSLPVLLVVGEELIGAKQNRVLNTSVLVPAQSEITIPVSCVEQGRWSYRSTRFESGGSTAHFSLRKAQVANVTKNLREFAAYDANQGEVWGEVERKFRSHDATSPTRALHELYEQADGDLKSYLEAFVPPSEAQGVLIMINGQVVGADVFDHTETLQHLWQKLLRGYALDALEQRQKSAPKTEYATQEFFAQLHDAQEEPYPSVGLGEDVRLSSNRVSGSGLLWEDQIIHAGVFNLAG